MGNSLELGQKALEALKEPETFLRVLSVSAQAFKAMWLLLDHAIWFGKIDFIKVTGLICTNNYAGKYHQSVYITDPHFIVI